MLERLRIVELNINDSPPMLEYSHLIESYYDVSVLRDAETWTIKLTRKPLDVPQEKRDQSRLFRSYISEPRVFFAEVNGEQVGWIELGYPARARSQ